MKLAIPTVALFWCALPCLSQVVPAVDLKALDGTRVVFPKSGSSKPLLLMLGFSRQSSVDFENWNRRFKSKYWSDSRIEFYELVDLQGVPSFVKPVILHGMRQSIKGAEQSHFAPFYSEEDKWKQLASYSTPQDAYLLLTDSRGHIVWKTQGPATDDKCAELESAIARLAASSH